MTTISPDEHADMERRLARLEQDAERRRFERGQLRLAARAEQTDQSVTALTNQSREFAATLAELRAFRAEQQAANRDMARKLERALAVPLSLVTFFALQSSGAGAQATIGATVAALALALLFPERAGLLLRRTAEAASVAAADAEPAKPSAADRADDATTTKGPIQ